MCFRGKDGWGRGAVLYASWPLNRIFTSSSLAKSPRPYGMISPSLSASLLFPSLLYRKQFSGGVASLIFGDPSSHTPVGSFGNGGTPPSSKTRTGRYLLFSVLSKHPTSEPPALSSVISTFLSSSSYLRFPSALSFSPSFSLPVLGSFFLLSKSLSYAVGTFPVSLVSGRPHHALDHVSFRLPENMVSSSLNTFSFSSVLSSCFSLILSRFPALFLCLLCIEQSLDRWADEICLISAFIFHILWNAVFSHHS